MRLVLKRILFLKILVMFLGSRVLAMDTLVQELTPVTDAVLISYDDVATVVKGAYEGVTKRLRPVKKGGDTCVGREVSKEYVDKVEMPSKPLMSHEVPVSDPVVMTESVQWAKSSEEINESFQEPDRPEIDWCAVGERRFDTSKGMVVSYEKPILWSIWLTTVAGMVLVSLNNSFQTVTAFKRYTVLGAAAGCLLMCASKFLPNLVKNQEKYADIMAAQALIEAGKQHIVEQYIQWLKEHAHDDQGTMWQYSSAEKIAYLEPLLIF